MRLVAQPREILVRLDYLSRFRRESPAVTVGVRGDSSAKYPSPVSTFSRPPLEVTIARFGMSPLGRKAARATRDPTHLPRTFGPVPFAATECRAHDHPGPIIHLSIHIRSCHAFHVMGAAERIGKKNVNPAITFHATMSPRRCLLVGVSLLLEFTVGHPKNCHPEMTHD